LLLRFRSLNLRNEDFVITLGLVELLRRPRMLLIETSRALVSALCYSELHLKHVDLTSSFGCARRSSLSLCENLFFLERELNSVDNSDYRTERERHSLGGRERQQLSVRFG
jgi:hypothetical protein